MSAHFFIDVVPDSGLILLDILFGIDGSKGIGILRLGGGVIIISNDIGVLGKLLLPLLFHGNQQCVEAFLIRKLHLINPVSLDLYFDVFCRRNKGLDQKTLRNNVRSKNVFGI